MIDMRHSKMRLGEVNGQKVLMLQTNSSRKARRSVQHGKPSPEVQAWARNLLRITANGGHIAITDGTTLRVRTDRRRLYMENKGTLYNEHVTVFSSVGWTIIDDRPHVKN